MKMAGLAKGSLSCCLGVLLIGLGCGSPTGSSSSRRVFFRNYTYTAYQVNTQSERLQFPTGTLVLPEETRDISLASIESRDHLAISLLPQVPQGARYRFPAINLEIVLNDAGWVDANAVTLSVMKDDGTRDDQGSVLADSLLKVKMPSPSSQLILEAREFQDSLRVFVDNETDNILSVIVNLGQEDTVKVGRGIFPVTGFIKSSPDSILLSLVGDTPKRLLPERDLLFQAQFSSPDSIVLRPVYDLPPQFRTGTPKVKFQFLDK